jgi:hypothetical protein
MSRSPALVAVTAGLLALLAIGPVAALAADLPADVVADATVTVVVSDPDGSGAPLEGMTVTLSALRLDLAEPVIQVSTGTTDAAGVAVFEGVARPLDGAPAVALEARADIEIPTDCGSQRWSGWGMGFAAPTVELPVVIDEGSTSCVARSIAGFVLDADGQPFPVASAVAAITIDEVTTQTPVAVGDDGAFAIRVDSPLDASVRLTVESPILEVPGQPGCVLRVIERADSSWDLPAGASVPEQDVIAQRSVLATVCGTTGTPAPEAPAPTAGGPQGPSLTLPPTDVGARASGSGAAGSGLNAALLVVAGLSFVALTVASRRRRRVVVGD